MRRTAPAQASRSRRTTNGRSRVILALAFTLITLAVPAHCGHNHACIVQVARHDCKTWRDDHHCDIVWRADHPARIDPPDPVLAPAQSSTGGSFAQCVAFRESSGNPDAIDPSGTYWGLYQFDSATWAAATSAMGVAWPYGSATPSEQTAAFEYWSARYPGAWPNTIPACGGT